MTGMKTLALALSLTACGACTTARAPQANRGYWPTHEWTESSPEAQGMESRTLAKALDYIREHHVSIHGLLVVRNGRVVLDATFFPYQAGQLHDVASVTKSVTATLIGIAVGRHKLAGAEQQVLSLFPSRTNYDPRKERLTIRHLLTMTSGIACDWMSGETTLEEMQNSADWIQFVLERPMAAEPGSAFAYCSPGMHLLSGVISRVTGSSALEFARRELFRPLGIHDAEWPADPHGISRGWGDLHLHPRDMAKLGLLWLNGGRWEGTQIVPAAWMKEASRPHSLGTGWAEGNAYGYGFWVDSSRTPPTIAATGRGGQRIRVMPEKSLIVVLVGRFDVSDVDRFITEAIVSDGAIREDAEAKALLDTAIAAAAKPPALRSPSALPSLADTVSGEIFSLDDNPLRLKTLSVSFRSASQATVRLEFGDGRVEQRPVALDGVPRISPGGRFGLPVALSGGWEGPNVFSFDYDEVANINSYRYRLRFAGRELSIEVTEQTGLLHAQFKGERH
jgi:CubicO group peptidase (beta-lactamase class C family)